MVVVCEKNDGAKERKLSWKNFELCGKINCNARDMVKKQLETHSRNFQGSNIQKKLIVNVNSYKLVVHEN